MHWGESIVCRKVNLSFCGFAPTHLYPDHLQTCTQTCIHVYIHTGPVWSWEHADHYWWTGWVTDLVPPRDERFLRFTLRFYEKSRMNQSNISPKHDHSDFIFSPSWQWKHGQGSWIYRNLSGDSQQKIACGILQKKQRSTELASSTTAKEWQMKMFFVIKTSRCPQVCAWIEKSLFTPI